MSAISSEKISPIIVLYMEAGRPLVDVPSLLLSCSRLQKHQPIGDIG